MTTATISRIQPDWSPDQFRDHITHVITHNGWALQHSYSTMDGVPGVQCTSTVGLLRRGHEAEILMVGAAPTLAEPVLNDIAFHMSRHSGRPPKTWDITEGRGIAHLVAIRFMARTIPACRYYDVPAVRAVQYVWPAYLNLANVYPWDPQWPIEHNQPVAEIGRSS